MLVHKAYKFRIYPNKAQETFIARTIGCSRFVFNHFLAKWRDTYNETGKGLTYHACSNQLPSLKREYDWLKEVDSIAFNHHLKTSLIPISVFSKSKIKHHDLSQKSILFSRIQLNSRTEILLYLISTSSYPSLV